MKKGKTEYACSDKISIADFCMVAMNEDLVSDAIAAESLADEKIGLIDYFLFMKGKIKFSSGSIVNKSMTEESFMSSFMNK